MRGLCTDIVTPAPLHRHDLVLQLLFTAEAFQGPPDSTRALELLEAICVSYLFIRRLLQFFDGASWK